MIDATIESATATGMATEKPFPLVSVVIPAYNAEKFIRDTLESVRSQTYQTIEIIVVDDGSTDQTAAIVESFSQRDPRIQLFRQANAGVVMARNHAIQAARGEYIAPLDADDIWYPQKLEKQVHCFLRSPQSVGMVYAWSVDIDVHNRITGGFCAWSVEGEILIPLLYSNYLGNGSSPLIRRDCFKQVGGYSATMKAFNAEGCEDWDLYLRIAERYEVRVIPELLIGYRQHSSSTSGNVAPMRRSFEIMLQDLQQRQPQIPSKVLNWTRSRQYFYLAERSLVQNNSQQAIVYLTQALRFDYLCLLYLGYYRLWFNSLRAKFNQNRAQSKPQLKSSELSSQLSDQPTLSIEDVYRKIDRKRQNPLARARDWILQRRWKQFSHHQTQ